jgi:hypothetical protein
MAGSPPSALSLDRAEASTRFPTIGPSPTPQQRSAFRVSDSFNSKLRPIRVARENRLAPITPVHHVVNSSFIFDPEAFAAWPELRQPAKTRQ